MAFTERERQIMVGVDLEPQTADEGALHAFAESCGGGSGGGGSGATAVLGIPCAVDMTVNPPTITTDAVFAEVLAAVQAGAVAQLVCDVNIGAEGYEQTEYVPLVRRRAESDDQLIFSVLSYMGDGDLTYLAVTFDATGTTLQMIPLTNG